MKVAPVVLTAFNLNDAPLESKPRGELLLPIPPEPALNENDEATKSAGLL